MVRVVGEYHSRSDEHAVFKLSRLIHEGVILDLDIVADDDAGTYVRPSPDDAVAAQRAFPDLRKMPHRRSRAEYRLVMNVRRSCHHWIFHRSSLLFLWWL